MMSSAEHRGLDHKGVMRECIQEVHFCWPVGRDDEGDAPKRRGNEDSTSVLEMKQRVAALDRTISTLK